MHLVGVFLIVTIDISVAIMISFTTAVVWTRAHVVGPVGTASATNIKNPGGNTGKSPQGRGTNDTKYSSLTDTAAQKLWHIKPPDKIDDEPHTEIVSHVMMVIVGMGLVYAIYSGITAGECNDQHGLRLKAGTVSSNAESLQKAAQNNATTLEPAANTLESNVKALRNQEATSQAYENATNVIQNFEKVETEYIQLSEDQKESVKDKFEALKKLYDSTFKFTKIKYYSTQLATAAQNLSSNPGKVNEVITNFNSVVDAYKALGETEQGKVQSEFDELQKEYSEAIYYYKWHFITLLPS